ncbi:lytic transglycosylase domain-containing protein [Acidocella sp.]|uniref:lytic transglycosylase domain-containing protein n=1 Tax=Acidocella sp. TaxID=50710 RepID=UPI002634490B|nr:lytic transglycosylase domain-containing protein [Acidocella sp.]
MSSPFRPRASSPVSLVPGLKLRLALGCAGLALLTACAGGGGPQGEDTSYYLEHAQHDYNPPGPPGDPWGPYIAQASARFDVPQPWIRWVMRIESGGHEYINGQLTVSQAGAIGLMQLEPETYREMAARYWLGDDPFNPYDNIMAGTAYIHEMYAIYGMPGFLAAYNAGPGRLNKFENQGEPLPDETIAYVEMIAPHIQGYYPQNRSQADELAMNTEPMGGGGILPPGFVVGGPPASSGNIQLADNTPIAPPAPSSPSVSPVDQTVLSAPSPSGSPLYTPNATPTGATVTPYSRVAASTLPPPPPAGPAAPVRMAAYVPPPPPPPANVPHTPAFGYVAAPGSFSYTPPKSGMGNLAAELQAASSGAPPPHPVSSYHPAMVEAAYVPPPPPPPPSGELRHGHGPHGAWAIQIGAFDSSVTARRALGHAELTAVDLLQEGHPTVVTYRTEGHTRYRARFVGLAHDDAVSACSRLGADGCFVVPPG